MECPQCGKPMVLRKEECRYVCSDFPECDATHGTHPNGEPLGIPADKETRLLRIEAHRLLGIYFGAKSKRGKSMMYTWLSQNSKSGHIGMMGKDELKNLIKKIPVRKFVRNSIWEQIKQKP